VLLSITRRRGHVERALAHRAFAVAALLVYTGDAGATFPPRVYMLPGVARALAGCDIAWVFQTYLARYARL
jgi:hypothetical protein